LTHAFIHIVLYDSTSEEFLQKEEVMARNLYRLYLHIVFIAMLIFAAVGLGMLLQTLFSLTSLRGAYGTIPTNASIVQAIVFFAVSWLIAAIFGILHYWLIRRDMQNDPTAGQSAIRSFFLNITELIDAPLAIVAMVLPNIDAVLDDLLAGKITRDEAAMRIQSMMSKEETHL
jgi:hypothetical protein